MTSIPKQASELEWKEKEETWTEFKTTDAIIQAWFNVGVVADVSTKLARTKLLGGSG